MPIYEFSCPRGHVTERLASMDTETIECPECGDEAPRRMSAPAGFDFRGPGFYATDYAPTKPSPAKDGAGKGGDGSGGADGGSGGSGGSSSEGASGSGAGDATPSTSSD